MKKLIIFLTLIIFSLSFQLTAKERSAHREQKQQRQSQVVKRSPKQARQQQGTKVRSERRIVSGKRSQHSDRRHEYRTNDGGKPSKISNRPGTGNKTVSVSGKDAEVTYRKNTRIYSDNRNSSDRKQIKAEKKSHKRKVVHKNRNPLRAKRHVTYQKDKQKLRRHASKHRRDSVQKQQHRRHHESYRHQHRHFHRNHFRGSHRHGRWHTGHGHYHYDYRYRHLYNPHQWYDNYYYHSYFDWRWDRGNHWGFGFYYNDYHDPYYCPDGFSEFVAGLAIGALIYNW